MVGLLRELWLSASTSLVQLGRVFLFLLQLLAFTPAALRRTRLIVHQIFNAGALSLVIIMTCGLFVGMVLGLLGYDLLSRVRSEEALGAGAALALTKQLGPVMTALLFAGRAGTALASEIGLMRATDQLSAMQMMAVAPVRRVLGGVLAMPCLTAIFISIGIFGVQLVGVEQVGIDSGSFWSQMRSAVELDDINEGMLKGCVFGIACSLIAVYEGYNSVPTAEGVGRATTRTVVISSVATLVLNFMLTAFML